mmetsp:Transcript_11968/g.16228  ORF Transcript_11968/g.16228 Transcript_11968/m.16228 type:complete len:642 (+) Transcript_11968:147-2072(+)
MSDGNQPLVESRKRRSRFDVEETNPEPAAKRPSRFGETTPSTAPQVSVVQNAVSKPALSLEAIQKAKATLQKHKEIAAKLKNMPQLQAVAAAKKAAAALSASGPAGIGSQPTGSASSVQPALQKVMQLAGALSQKVGLAGGAVYDPLPPPPPLPTASSTAPQIRPAPLRLDSQGREVDAYGNVIEIKTNAVATLKVNITQQKIAKFNTMLEEEKEHEKGSTRSFFDERMGGGAPKPRERRRTFAFVEPGRLEQSAQRSRLRSKFGVDTARQMVLKERQEAEARRRMMQASQELAAAGAVAPGGDVDPNMIPLGPRVRGGGAAGLTPPPPTPATRLQAQVPDVEWWDKPLLKTASYEGVQDGVWEVNTQKINLYVEHPVLLYPDVEAPEPPPQPLKLTKKEHKKLRTQRRLQREKEKQEMIKQGLLDAPKPKVKISNLMRVMGMEATQDPTAIEKEVRAQMEERQAAHDDRNLARKLTVSERREKKLRKMFEDVTNPETVTAIYKVKDLSNKQLQWKVDVNAQENELTGVCVLLPGAEVGFSCVIVEGASKSQRRYAKLMLRRLDWNLGREEDVLNEEGNPPEPNCCVRVWQGAVKEPSFKRFKFETCRTIGAAQKLLSDAGVGHFWDIVVNAGWEGVSQIV